MWTDFLRLRKNNIINHFMKSNLTIKISSSFKVGYKFDTKTSMVVYVL